MTRTLLKVTILKNTVRSFSDPAYEKRDSFEIFESMIKKFQKKQRSLKGGRAFKYFKMVWTGSTLLNPIRLKTQSMYVLQCVKVLVTGVPIKVEFRGGLNLIKKV